MRSGALVIAAVVLTGCASMTNSANPGSSTPGFTPNPTSTASGQQQGSPTGGQTNPSHVNNSRTGTHTGAAPTTSSSSPTSTAVDPYPSNKAAAARTALKASDSQVTCAETGGTLKLDSYAVMNAPDVSEVFAIATVGCKSGSSYTLTKPEVLHFRDGAWYSVGTISLKGYTWAPTGPCSATAKTATCPITNSTSGRAVAATLTVTRKGQGFWARIK